MFFTLLKVFIRSLIVSGPMPFTPSNSLLKAPLNIRRLFEPGRTRCRLGLAHSRRGTCRTCFLRPTDRSRQSRLFCPRGTFQQFSAFFKTPRLLDVSHIKAQIKKGKRKACPDFIFYNAASVLFHTACGFCPGWIVPKTTDNKDAIKSTLVRDDLISAVFCQSVAPICFIIQAPYAGF